MPDALLAEIMPGLLKVVKNFFGNFLEWVGLRTMQHLEFGDDSDLQQQFFCFVLNCKIGHYQYVVMRCLPSPTLSTELQLAASKPSHSVHGMVWSGLVEFAF